MELEDLRDARVRIISIGDSIDFPNDDDWLKIQFQFLINEMPVTDTSKKVRNVIKRRQADGKWICAAPYGYIINQRQEFEIVPTEADIVRTIFRLYNEEGWGYKKIANYLTDQGVPTPRMAEGGPEGAAGKGTIGPSNPDWAIVTVQGILDNDFYIGTLRQGKYTRKKINGRDILRDEDEQIVIENHHQAIIDYRTFATTRALREERTTSHYRGVKKYDNVYSGFLVCGDCGSPMFAMSRGDLKSAYTCGTYHRRGRAGCTSHHIRADKLDELLKAYVRQVMDHSADMLARLNEDLAREREDVQETEQSADRLAEVLTDLQEELKVTKRQRIRDLMKHPEQEELLSETYDELEADLQKKIEGIRHQIDMLSDKRNTIIQVNRAARTMESSGTFSVRTLGAMTWSSSSGRSRCTRITWRSSSRRMWTPFSAPGRWLRAARSRRGRHGSSRGRVNFKEAWSISHLSPSSRSAKSGRTRCSMPMLSVTVTPWRSSPAGRAWSSSRNTPSWAGWGTSPPSCASPSTRPPARWSPSPTGTSACPWPAAAGGSSPTRASPPPWPRSWRAASSTSISPASPPCRSATTPTGMSSPPPPPF